MDSTPNARKPIERNIENASDANDKNTLWTFCSSKWFQTTLIWIFLSVKETMVDRKYPEKGKYILITLVWSHFNLTLILKCNICIGTSSKLQELITFWPFNSQDLIMNSPYNFPYVVYHSSSENLIFSSLIFLFLLVTFLFRNEWILYWGEIPFQSLLEVKGLRSTFTVYGQVQVQTMQATYDWSLITTKKIQKVTV